jgi:tetratricopeptide (TPR) repeat protein
MLLKRNETVNKRWFSILCVATLLSSAVSPAGAEAQYSVGDTVIVVRESQLRRRETRDAQHVRRGTILAVETVQGSWLWVNYGKPGWIGTSDVMPREQAVEYFSKQTEVRPDDADAYRCRGKALLSLGDSQRAIADFNQALQKAEFPLAYSDRGLAWSLAGQYDKAVADFSRALETGSRVLTDDERAGILGMRGLARAGEGQLAKAIADFGEAIRLVPDFAFAFNYRGKAWLAQGDSTMKAISDFNEAIRVNPLFDSAFNNRGLAWASMGEFQNAIADFCTAVQLDPNAAFARSTRSRFLHDAIRRSGNHPSPEDLAPLDPLESPDNNLALLLATCPDDRFRNGKEAMERAERVCRLDGYHYFPFLTTLAAAHAETGDYAGAVQWQSKAMELAPQDERDELQSRLALYRAGKPYRQKRGD